MATVEDTFEDRTKYEFLKERRRAYQLTYSSPAGQDVLLDLMRFCRANESCVVIGDRDRTAMLEGRREVWLRIVQHLNLKTEQLFALYNGTQAGLALTEGDTDGTE